MKLYTWERKCICFYKVKVWQDCVRNFFYDPLTMSFNYFEKRKGGITMFRCGELQKWDDKDSFTKPQFNYSWCQLNLEAKVLITCATERGF